MITENIDLARARALQRAADRAHAIVADADRQRLEARDAIQRLERDHANKRREAAERPSFIPAGRVFRDVVADLERQLEEARAEFRRLGEEWSTAAAIWAARRRLADRTPGVQKL